MMLATQVLEMLQAIILAVLAFGGWIEVWHVVALTVMLGLCVAVELPVRHAYLLELIGDKADLPNAVATTSLVANCGRLIGPSIAGMLIASFSEATCFLINAISYIAVLASFAFIRVTPQPRAASHPPALRGILEGAQYAWRTLPIRLLLTVLALVALTAAPYSTLMPAVVHEAFDGNAQTLGFLVGAAGCGAVIATLLLASRSTVRGLLRFIVAAAVVCGLALIALSQSRLLPLSLVMMALIGGGILVTSVSINMILQTIVEDDKRGRVMSLYTAGSISCVNCRACAIICATPTPESALPTHREEAACPAHPPPAIPTPTPLSSACCTASPATAFPDCISRPISSALRCQRSMPTASA
jgi:MFS family permease